MIIVRTHHNPFPQKQSWCESPYFYLNMQFDFLSEFGNDP